MFLLAFVACSSPTPAPDSSVADADADTDAPTASAFADASGDTLSAVLASAYGQGSLLGFLSTTVAGSDAAAEIQDDDGVVCPVAAFDGALLTLSADGCTGRVSGLVWDGEAAIDNAPGVAQLVAEAFFHEDLTDPEQPYLFQFEAWSQASGCEALWVDGTFGASNWGQGAAWTAEQDLAVEVDGYPAFSTVSAMSCTRDARGVVRCTPTRTQVGEVAGLGTLRVTGEITSDADGALGGVLRIEGAEDALSLDLGAMEAGCVDLGFDDGDTRRVCLPGSTGGEESPPRSTIDEGPIWGLLGPAFADEGLWAGALMATEVAAVDLDLNASVFSDVGFESHPLAVVGYDTDAGVWNWEGTFAYGVYVPGVSTAVPPGDHAFDLATRLVARDADGRALGCFFQVPSGEPDDWFDNSTCPRA